LQHALEQAAQGVSQLPSRAPTSLPMQLSKLGLHCPIHSQEYDDVSFVNNPDFAEVVIPLAFSEVLHAAVPSARKTDLAIRKPWKGMPSPGSKKPDADEPTHVLLLAPHVAESDAHRPVWLICGRFQASDLQTCLADLSDRGSVRWDLRESYAAAKRCGQGLHGTVFIGSAKGSPHRKLDARASRKVAIKVMSSDEERIRREIQFMSQSREHPNIAALLGVFRHSKGSDSPSYAVVMELGHRGDVAALLAAGALPQQRGAEIMLGVTSALGFLHSRRIVHRDVKPENVVLHADARAMLVDFSIAVSLDDPDALAKGCGTPGYMAPEMILQRPHNEAVDTFAAGVLWYALLCGHLPFSGNRTEEILAKSCRCDVDGALEAVPAGAASGVAPLLRGMLAREPDSRLSALQCFVSFWDLSETKSKVCVDSMMVLADAGLMPKLVIPLEPHPGSEGPPMLPIESKKEKFQEKCLKAADAAVVHPDRGSFSASHVMDYVFQSFCFQRWHVFQTHQMLLVGAH